MLGAGVAPEAARHVHARAEVPVLVGETRHAVVGVGLEPQRTAGLQQDRAAAAASRAVSQRSSRVSASARRAVA